MLGRARKWTSSIGAATVVSLIALALVASSVPSAAASNSFFNVLSSTWAASSGEVGPGSTNAQLVVVVEYTGLSAAGAPIAATAVQVTLYLPSGFTDTTGNSAPTDGVPTVSADSTFSLKYNLTIASNVPVGTYKVGVIFDATVAGAGYSESYTTMVSLQGTVDLSLRASQFSLNAGTVNSIYFTLTNNGTGTATQIKPSVSTSSGSVLTVLPLIPSLGPDSSVRLVVNVFIPASTASQSIITSVAGSPVVLTFTTAYDDGYGSSLTSTQAIGFHAVSALEPILSVTPSSGLLIPGQVNNIRLVLTNLGPGNITRVYNTITASAGFSILNQIPMIPVLDANVPVNATVRVFAPATAAGTAMTLTFAYSYLDPYGTSTSGSQTLGFYAASTSSVASGTYLSVGTSGNSLTAGQESLISFAITNTGQQPVYSPTFLLSVPSPLLASLNSSVSFAKAIIKPGESVNYDAIVSSSTGATGGSYSGTLSITYTDQSGNTYSETVPVAFVLAVPVYRVSETTTSTEVMVGTATKIAFQVRNIGNVPIYSPEFSLSVPSGLAVTTNSTYSRVGLEISPGQTFTYVANVTSGPSTAEGAYIGTLVVSYTDQYGNQYSQTFSPGLVLVGGIDLVIQDLTAAQSGASLTVSGTLLNEGQGSAYYLQVTGSAASGTPGTAYVGEVDPNTPVPFSLTVPYRAGSGGSNADLALVASYDNNYGQALESKFAQPISSLTTGTGVTLTSGSGSASRTGSGTSSSSTNVFRYAVIAAILIAIVAAALYVRRSRPRKAASGKVDSNVI